LTAIVKTNFTLSINHNWPVRMMRAHIFFTKLLVLSGGTLPTEIALWIHGHNFRRAADVIQV